MKHPISKTISKVRWFTFYRVAIQVGILTTAFSLCPSIQGNQAFELAQQHAARQGGHLVFIEGTSMEPRLTEQDLVVVVPVPWHKLKPGDIVQFYVSKEMRNERNSQATWIHQIAAKDGNWIRTVGVNNPELDPFWVHKRDVLGKAVAVYMGGGMEVPSVSDRAMAYFEVKSKAGNISKK